MGDFRSLLLTKCLRKQMTGCYCIRLNIRLAKKNRAFITAWGAVRTEKLSGTTLCVSNAATIMYEAFKMIRIGPSLRATVDTFILLMSML